MKGPPFAVDQRVWSYWPRPPLRQQHRKLQRLWTGPWRILSFKGQVVVVIQHEKSHKRQTVHIDRLAPCLTPDSHTATTSNTTACSTNDDTVRTDQPKANGQSRPHLGLVQILLTHLRHSTKLPTLTCCFLRFIVALAGSVDDQRH